MRLFVAVNFDEVTTQCIDALIKQMKDYTLRGRYTHRENLHLTLAFLGEVSPDQLPDLCQCLESIRSPEFNLTFNKLNRWKSERGSLYRLDAEPEPRLSELHSNIVRTIQSGCPHIKIESKPFKPHLTLGRDLELSQSVFEFQPISFKVSKISLMNSEVVDRKRLYTELHSVPFDC